MEKTEKEVEKLIQLLENSQIVKEYKEAQKAVFDHQEVLKQLKDYHRSKDPQLEKAILQDETYQVYHQKASSLSLLLFAMHRRFQKRRGDEFQCGLSKENTKEEN